jgi:HPt (histidine-containing phosphotransfer) domain-containing protein
MNYKELSDALGLDESEYIELLHLFVESGKSDLEKLQTALADLDFQQIIQSAHTLKGASGNLGLLDIYEAAAQIERNAAGRQIEMLTQQVQLIADQMKAIASCVPN